jgi:hypothetical protein
MLRHGVATWTLTAGQEYSMAIATAALFEDWEFNLGVTRFAEDRSANTDEEAWGFTWSARLAVYKIVPRCAIVGEAFGTAGEAYSYPQYNFGLRWESPKLALRPPTAQGSTDQQAPASRSDSPTSPNHFWDFED